MTPPARRVVALAAVLLLVYGGVSSSRAQVAPDWPGEEGPRELPGCEADENRGICFDFESTDEMLWMSPDWARTTEGYFAAGLNHTTESAYSNEGSLRLDVWYLDDRWSAAVIALPVEMSLTGYRRLSARLFVPAGVVPAGLKARFALVTDRWLWFETAEPVTLEPGKWVTLETSLEPGRLRKSWSVAKRGAELADHLGDVRNILLRIESIREGGLVLEGYSGALFVDDIRIER